MYNNAFQSNLQKALETVSFYLSVFVSTENLHMFLAVYDLCMPSFLYTNVLFV